MVLALFASSLGLGARAAASAAGDTELTVSAASSLSKAFEAIGAEFEREHPNVTVLLNLSGSNHLRRQIEATGGRIVDVVALAGVAPMDALIEQGLVDPGSRRLLAKNEIVLIRPKDNPAGIDSFADLSRERVKRIAIGSDGVPVGIYAQDVLRHYELLEPLADKLVRGIHARQILEYVARGECDAGMVYATDAAMMPDTVAVVRRAPPESHRDIEYPIAILSRSEHHQTATAFVDFATSETGRSILRAHGFIAPAPSGASPHLAESTAPAAPGQSIYAAAWSAMKLSLIVSVVALMFVFPVGTAIGAMLAKWSFPGRELIDAMLTLPMILPPTVTGFYLIFVLGSRSTVGQWLESWFGVRVALTLLGAAVASTVIALPLMIKSARAAIESVDRDLELASYSLGKGRLETFFRVTLPLARHGLVAGAILSFARAIGEFGATFMLAGLIPGKTMTMPSAIFDAFTNHDDDLAWFLVAVLTVFSVLVIYVTNRLNARQMGKASRSE